MRFFRGEPPEGYKFHDNLTFLAKGEPEDFNYDFTKDFEVSVHCHSMDFTKDSDINVYCRDTDFIKEFEVVPFCPNSDFTKDFEVNVEGANVNLRAVAFGNGMFVAVGRGIPIATSPDGINWTIRRLPNEARTMTFNAIAFGNGAFVAVGNSGCMARSRDGVNWTVATISGSHLNGITFARGMFVAVGSGARVITSEFGVIWTPMVLTFEYLTVSRDLNCIAFGNNVFIAGGDHGFFAVSSDGVNWFGTSVFWQTGGASSNEHFESITFGNGVFVLMSTQWTYTSQTGRRGDWQPLSAGSGPGSLNHPNDNYLSIAHGGGLFVSVGSDRGVSISEGNARVWRDVRFASPVRWRSIAHGNGTFVAVGGNWVLRSLGGWTQRMIPPLTSINP
jgi:hypothetical protein